MRSAVEINDFLRSLLDPEVFGNDVSEEVKERASCLLAMEELQNGSMQDEILASPWSAGRSAEQSPGISISPISINEVDNISITTDNMSSVVHIPETLNDVISMSSYDNYDNMESITITNTLEEPLTVTFETPTEDTIILNPEGDE